MSKSYDVFTVVAMAKAVIDEYGYVSTEAAKNNGGTTTAVQVKWRLEGRIQDIEPIPEQKHFAVAAINWVVGEVAAYGFYKKMIASIKGGRVYADKLGIVVCIAQQYERFLFKKAERQALEKSKHVGNPKTRLEQIGVTVLSIGEPKHSSRFGWSRMYKLVTDEGNFLEWRWADADCIFALTERVVVSFRVAEHLEHDNGAQYTKVTHLKLWKPKDEKVAIQKAA